MNKDKIRRGLLSLVAFLLVVPSLSSLLALVPVNTAFAAEEATYAVKGAIIYKDKTFIAEQPGSNIYALSGSAQKCSTGNSELPYEYISTLSAGGLPPTYNQIDLTKKDSTGRLTCEHLPSIELTIKGNPNTLFYKKGDSVFDYTGRYEFKKVGSHAGTPGGDVFVLASEVGKACPDAVVNIGNNWLFFPMATKSYVESKEVRHGSYAISERYASYLNNPSYNDACRVASLEIKNVFNLADFSAAGSVTIDDDGYDSCQLQRPELVEWNKLPNLNSESDFEVKSSFNWNWNNKDYVVDCREGSSDGTYMFAEVQNNIVKYKDGFDAEGDDAYRIVGGVSSIAPNGNVAPPTPPLLPGQGNANEAKTSCVIPSIGWILCPVLDIAAKITDGIYTFIAAFLTTRPLVNDPATPLFAVWSTMRNFANVAFVIVFLIIIFSQVTSIGITNYGIKRMLPRLIAGAILVNLSFWICAIAVDLSNIGGSSLKALFDGLGESLQLPVLGTTGWDVGTEWQSIVAGIIAVPVVGFALYFSLAALIPLLATCLMILIVVLGALILRQILIVLLIVISPIAFVAFLLPNTESLFNRWRQMLTTLLLLYPIAGLIFGASALAGRIIAQS